MDQGKSRQWCRSLFPSRFLFVDMRLRCDALRGFWWDGVDVLEDGFGWDS